MILSYWELFFLDLTMLSLCVVLMLRHGHLAALHPASLYFFFHAYTFTFRLFQLANGAPTLFTTWGPQFLPITHEEIQRASFVALASLLLMTLTWLRLASKWHLPPPTPTNTLYRPFSSRLMWMVAGVTMPIGLLALILLRGPVLSGRDSVTLGAWSSSSYIISLYQWFGVSLMALIFYYGFRKRLIIPFASYLIIGLLTFPFRAMVIIPGLFIIFTYFRRRNKSWPTMRLTVPIVTLVLLFVAGKDLGPRLRDGDFAGSWDLLVGRVVSLQEGTHNDATFMDQLAVTLSLVDEQDRFFFGQTYVNLLVLPIPRQFWTDKPGQADWQKEIETLARPTATNGAIVTALGEAYANFGYLGIIFYSVLLASILAQLYKWMQKLPYYSLANFWSLSVYSILIQVFRDGITSFIAFQTTILMPLTIISLLHVVALRRRVNVKTRTVAWATIFDDADAYIDTMGRTRHRLPG